MSRAGHVRSPIDTLLVGAVAVAALYSGVAWLLVDRHGLYVAADGNLAARPAWQILTAMAVGVLAALLLIGTLAALLARPGARGPVVVTALTALLAAGSTAVVTGVFAAALTGFRNDVPVRATVATLCCVTYVLVARTAMRRASL